MKWWKGLVDKWKGFIEDTAEANEKMWKGRKPSCCGKKEQSNEEETPKA